MVPQSWLIPTPLHEVVIYGRRRRKLEAVAVASSIYNRESNNGFQIYVHWCNDPPTCWAFEELYIVIYTAIAPSRLLHPNRRNEPLLKSPNFPLRTCHTNHENAWQPGESMCNPCFCIHLQKEIIAFRTTAVTNIGWVMSISIDKWL